MKLLFLALAACAGLLLAVVCFEIWGQWSRSGSTDGIGATQDDAGASEVIPGGATAPAESDSLRLTPRPEDGPGRVRLRSSVLDFRLEADAWGLVAPETSTSSDASSSRIELIGFRVENTREDVIAHGVTLHVVDERGAPAARRLVIGDLDSGRPFDPKDIEIVLESPYDARRALRIYLAYHVAADEPTWLISETVPLELVE